MSKMLNFGGLSRLKYGSTQRMIWIILAVFYLFGTSVYTESTKSVTNDDLLHLLTEDGIQSFGYRDHLHTLAEFPDHGQCALVDQAVDQCAWVTNNCEDQDSGILSYLDLYYCKLPQAKPVAMTIIILWLAILFSTIGITASDYFCVNLSTISALLGLSESVTGVTLLAFGNGSPDVFSTWAAMSSNSGSLAIGELIGAAGFITAVVAGSMAIVRPFKVARKSFVRDLGFFIVATAFSLAFLIDGHLDLWECIVMVAYYVFYVIVVIIWHWQSKKRKARKARDLLAREHFLAPEYTDTAPNEDDEEDGTVGAPANGTTEDEFNLLEQSETAHIDDDNEDDETRDRYMAELTTNMRISRPRGVSRENTRNPIRPSLVGALEFRAVLSSLERSRSHLSIPLYMRRYSDDAVTGIEQQNRLNRADSDLDPIAVRPSESGNLEQYRNEPLSARPRAVSTNALDMRTPSLVPPELHPNNDQPTPEISTELPRLLIPIDNDIASEEAVRVSPVHLSPASAERSPQQLSSVSPTENNPNIFIHDSTASLNVPGVHNPATRGESCQSSDIGQTVHGGHFARYHDDPHRVGRSRASIISLPGPELAVDDNLLARAAKKWWPEKYLPAPDELFSALFPTLSNWSQKSLAQRALALITAPSVFFLNITLPVVEAARDVSDERRLYAGSSPNAANPNGLAASNSQTPIIRALDEHGHTQPTLQPPSDSQSTSAPLESSPTWHRWLLCTQLIFAPSFVVATFWANFDDDHDVKTLLVGLGIGLIFSLVGVLLVLLTSDEKTAPRYRPAFCIVGFAVSVSWISTIANEVVGILKALGIVLNISEAILGLTIFAVGSSLGDLVADITIARLGYPMMALSACFGGPMLNILLGIGLGGIYLLLQRGEKYHHKHPDRPIKYKSYHIAIDRTLVVSSVALLITLIGLAIAVPMNGWRMSRRIGWALIAVWTVATAVNLGVEIGGLSRDVEAQWI